jgi:hypothetical protein
LHGEQPGPIALRLEEVPPGEEQVRKEVAPGEEQVRKEVAPGEEQVRKEVAPGEEQVRKQVSPDEEVRGGGGGPSEEVPALTTFGNPMDPATPLSSTIDFGERLACLEKASVAALLAVLEGRGAKVCNISITHSLAGFKRTVEMALAGNTE